MNRDPGDFLAALNARAERTRREQIAEEFKSFDRRALFRMDDRSLAEWQAQFSPDQAQYILAEHEWQRRLCSEQVAATKFAAIAGIVGVVVGVSLGWCLSSVKPPEFHGVVKVHQQAQPETIVLSNKADNEAQRSISKSSPAFSGQRPHSP